VLRQWQGLPSLVSDAHVPLLQRFQRLVEVQESAQMLHDILTCSRQGQMPNVKNFMTTWRERCVPPCAQSPACAVC
jgi:transformation/transcription domain-associated protein